MCRFLLIASAMLLSASTACGQQEVAAPLQDDKQVESFQGEWVHGLGRATFAGADVQPSVFVAETSAYSNSLGVIALVIIVTGTVCCLLGCVTACVVFMKKSDEDDEPSVKEVVCIRTSLVVIPVMILICLIVGFVGNSYLGGPQTFFEEQLKEEAKSVSKLYSSIVPDVDAMYLAQNWRQSGRTFTATYLAVPFLAESNNSVVDTADTGADVVAQSETGRAATFWVVVAFAIITLLISCAASAMMNRELSQATAMCSFLLVGLLSVSIAAHFCFNVIMADLCYDIRRYESGGLKGIEARVTDRNIALKQAFDTNTEAKFDYTKSVLQTQFVHCPDYANSARVVGFVSDALLNDTINAFNAIQFNCSSCCSGGTCMCSSSSVCDTLRQNIINLNTTIIPKLVYLRDCSWTRRAIDNRLANSDDDCVAGDGKCGGLCANALSGLVMIYVTAFVSAIFFCCLGVVGILGDNRFKDPVYF